MLPTNEIDTLTMTVTDAIDLATEGEVADGYACLVWGLHRAEEMVEEGLPWGEKVGGRWRVFYLTNLGDKDGGSRSQLQPLGSHLPSDVAPEL